MRRLRQWIARLRGTLAPSDRENRLDEEIRFHLEMHTERDARAGRQADDAERAALVAFGGREQWREAARDEYRDRRVEGVFQDARYAVRTLRKSLGFTIVALLTFALGIGANTAVFSVVSGILLRPLPFADPSRLVSVWSGRGISNAELLYFQEHAQSLAQTVMFSPGWGVAMTGAGEPRQLDASRVSTNFFQTLGVRPALGRTFQSDESSAGKWDVAIISHHLWINHFNGDPNVVGRVVTMDARPHRIIGVMPRGFEAFQAGDDAWLPLQIDPSSSFHTGQIGIAFGRLAPNATVQTATAELATLAPQMRTAFSYTEDYARGATVASLHENLVGNVRQSLFVLLGAAALLMLIAAANVGNLLLVHAVGRRRELAIRRALGASRVQIARQLLVQSVVLAGVGGVLGTAVGFAGVRALKAVLPGTLPMLSAVGVDFRVLLVSAIVTIGAGVLFGVAPALFASRVDPEDALRGGVSGAANRATALTRRTLVVVEMALAMVLVVGAGLMTQTLWQLARVDLGFDPRGVLSFRIQPTSGQVRSPEQARVYFDDMTQRLAALPGVESVGGAQHLPLSGFNWNGNLDIESRPIPSTARHPRVVWRSVVGDYFGAMRIRLIRGRLFTATDTRDAPPVVVITEAMAKRFWPDRDPLGERIKLGNGTRNDWATIVGIVGSVRFASPDAEPGDEAYRPNAQQGLVFMHMVVRTKTAPLALVTAVRTAVRSLDTTVPIAEVQSLGDLYTASIGTRRTIALLLIGFAGVGLLLGAVGIYGVISYAVSQRTRELGIRTALGALEGRIVGMVLGEGMRMAATGIAIGSVAAVIAARSLQQLVFGVTTTNVATYAGVALALVLVALLASYVPARRAARVDPLTALRTD